MPSVKLNVKGCSNSIFNSIAANSKHAHRAFSDIDIVIF